MSKVFGLQSDFALIRKDISRTVIGYGLTPEQDGEHATWHEVVIYRKKVDSPTINNVKDAVIKDINDRTDEKILSGFVWNDINVYLSSENQRNFSEAQRMASAIPAILPLTFKLGEDSEETPVYHTFETAEELNEFYMSAFAYINQCLNEGWQEKDSIDWSEYEEALGNPVIDDLPEPEPEPSDEQQEDVPEETDPTEPSDDDEGQSEETEDTPSEDDEPVEEEPVLEEKDAEAETEPVSDTNEDSDEEEKPLATEEAETLEIPTDNEGVETEEENVEPKDEEE